jgi:hypothetical protein
MGRQEQQAKQKDLWVAQHWQFPPERPFYPRLRKLLDAEKPVAFVQARRANFCAAGMDVRCWRMASVAGVFRPNILKASRPSAGSPVTAVEFAALAAELLPNDTSKVSAHGLSFFFEVGAHLLRSHVPKKFKASAL